MKKLILILGLMGLTVPLWASSWISRETSSEFIAEPSTVAANACSTGTWRFNRGGTAGTFSAYEVNAIIPSSGTWYIDVATAAHVAGINPSSTTVNGNWWTVNQKWCSVDSTDISASTFTVVASTTIFSMPYNYVRYRFCNSGGDMGGGTGGSSARGVGAGKAYRFFIAERQFLLPLRP